MNRDHELYEIRNKHVDDRWSQLYHLAKETGDDAIKYLFTINAGGAVAILAYLGSTSSKSIEVSSCIITALIIFFLGILSVGGYKAWQVHNFEKLFDEYKVLVAKYHRDEISWEKLIEEDDRNSENSILPYILGYFSFSCFIFASILAGISFS